MLNRLFLLLLSITFLFLLTGCSFKGEPQAETAETATAESEAASEDTASSSGDIQYIKWTPEVNVPDPVSISFDDDGRAYVTQTRRRRANDLDIRGQRDWIPSDVGFLSIEDKRKFYESELAPERSELNEGRFQDYNEDGLTDWRDLTFYNERIYIVEDTDDDGFADSSKIFYDDFATLVTGVAAGVLWHEGDVYATVAPDVWKFRDTDGDDIPDEKEVIAHGFGLHIAYGGHDMHGLIVGPDGKLYWSIGDKGVNLLSKEGNRFFYPNQGAVLRSNPDGSDFEVYAHGLRNVQEPAFDDYGNWFGVDNDSDQPGETERFMYIADGMDAGWRNHYQYRGDEYNPWIDEKMDVPVNEIQPAYILPAIRNYVDGPAGFVKNPGTALNDRYQDYFFLNSTMQGAQYAFQVEQDGASFKMINDHKIGEGLPLIGLTWGLDGALYTVDWGGGYPMNETGAIWKLDTPGANPKMRQEVKTILTEGMKERTVAELRKLLAHADQRLRLRAQFELVKRKETGALIEDSNDEHQLKRTHAIWGLGQLARQDDQAAVTQLVFLLNDSDSEVQVQSSKVLADLEPGMFDGQLLIPHLRSDSPRVRFQAGLSVGRQKVAEAFDAVVAMIAENNGADTYLRHSGVVALAGIGGAEKLVTHPSEEVRLVAVVALRRLADPAVAAFLSNTSERVVLEAVRAIHDNFSIPQALPQVAKLIVTVESDNEALVRRLINANFRIGGVNEAYQVAEYAANEERSVEMRLEALDSLIVWNSPPPLDRVDGHRRYYEERPVGEIAKMITGLLEGLLSSDDTLIVEKAVAAANSLSGILSRESLEKLLYNRQAPSTLRVEALKGIISPKTITYSMNNNDEGLRMAAAEFLVRTDKSRATDYLVEQLKKHRSISEQQKALALLSDLGTEAADRVIRAKAQELSLGQVKPELQLDVIEAATRRNMTEGLAGFESIRPESTIGAFVETLAGGNADAGQTVANTHIAAQCVRCHRFGREPGSEIGPRLGRIAQTRDREYLLRALVDPSADIAEGYGMTTVTLASGETISAQMSGVNEEGITLIMAEGDERFIESSTVESYTDPISSMPPMGLILSKREIRDVLEFLSGLGVE